MLVKDVMAKDLAFCTPQQSVVEAARLMKTEDVGSIPIVQDQGSNKLLAYDADGHFLYSWGTFGTCQGCQWGVHGFATDKDGNLYTAEVRSGRVQKYAPRKGANPAFMVGKPWPGVW